MCEFDRPIFAGRWAITRAEGAVLGFRSGDDYPTEGTSMDEKWRVSRVELLEGGLLYGFVLYDQKGQAECFVRLCGPRESKAGP